MDSARLPASATAACRLFATLGDDAPLAIVDALAIDAHDRLLAVGQYHHPSAGLLLVDLATRKERWRKSWSYTTADSIDDCAFSGDGERLWIALSDGRLRCYRVADGEQLKEIASGPWEYVAAVHLSRDARWAVIESSREGNPTGWSAAASWREESCELVAADGPDDAGDRAALMRAVVAGSPGRNALGRLDVDMLLARSPDGLLELIGVVERDEAAPRLMVRRRVDGRVVDVLTFRAGEVPLSATFSHDGLRFWAGTRSGLIFAWSLSP